MHLPIYLLTAGLVAALAANPHSDEAKFEHKILGMLDYSVDPCVDMYNFTCNLISPPGERLNGTIINLTLDTYAESVELLRKLKNDTSPDLSEAVKKAADLYDSCINSKSHMVLEISPELLKLDKNSCSGMQVETNPPQLDGYSSEKLMRCLSLIQISMPRALDYIYNVYGNHTPDLVKSKELMEDIKEAYLQNVKNLEWPDPVFRKNVVKILNEMKFYNGYPEWVKNKTALDLHYARMGNITGDYRKDRAIAIEYLNLNDSHKPIPSNTNWPHYLPTSAIVNAMYVYNDNLFYLPSGIQASPFYEPDRPAYFNYASLGFVIAHEMTHSLDSVRNETLWTPKAMKIYDKEGSCFDAEYKKFPSTGKPIDIELTRRDNIADNGAMSHSYTAYMNWSKKNSDNFVSGYTPGHLFFLSNALTWCQSDADYYDPRMDHSPNKARANIPLSLFKEFAVTYQCNSTEPMVSNAGCKLW